MFHFFPTDLHLVFGFLDSRQRVDPTSSARRCPSVHQITRVKWRSNMGVSVPDPAEHRLVTPPYYLLSVHLCCWCVGYAVMLRNVGHCTNFYLSRQQCGNGDIQNSKSKKTYKNSTFVYRLNDTYARCCLNQIYPVVSIVFVFHPMLDSKVIFSTSI